MIEAVLFDFDGTLTELRIDFHHLRDEVMKVLSRHVSAEQIDKKRWLFIIEMINELASECGPGKAEALVEDSFRRLVELECEAAEGNDLFPFTRDTLRLLRDRGMKIGIVTRSCMEAISLTFKDMPNYIDAVVTRDDTARVKPHPEHIETILTQLGIAPEKALMVGDHPTDILAGKACGATSVAVLSSVTSKEAFEEAGADYIVGDIRSVPEIVDALDRRKP